MMLNRHWCDVVSTLLARSAVISFVFYRALWIVYQLEGYSDSFKRLYSSITEDITTNAEHIEKQAQKDEQFQEALQKMDDRISNIEKDSSTLKRHMGIVVFITPPPLHPSPHPKGSQSIRPQVNSYSSQLVLILVNSYSSIWSIRTHLVNSYSLFGQFVLI